VDNPWDNTPWRPPTFQSLFARPLVIFGRMAGISVVCRRAGSEISRQLSAFVLQALLLGGELKIQASGLVTR
jgi:hypothetical protein